jgi:hypothetical protein
VNVVTRVRKHKGKVGGKGRERRYHHITSTFESLKKAIPKAVSLHTIMLQLNFKAEVCFKESAIRVFI